MTRCIDSAIAVAASAFALTAPNRTVLRAVVAMSAHRAVRESAKNLPSRQPQHLYDRSQTTRNSDQSTPTRHLLTRISSGERQRT
jgi:hypothetical protein